VVADSVTRGERNNNPGNIRRGVSWKGLAPVQLDPDFCFFVDAEHGIRAIGVILGNYAKEDGLRTIAEMVNRWAPPSDDNDTSEYVQFVATEMGDLPSSIIDTSDRKTLQAMTAVIIKQECAGLVYSNEIMDSAMGMIFA